MDSLAMIGGDQWMMLSVGAALILYLKVYWDRQSIAIMELCIIFGFVLAIFPSGIYSTYVLKSVNNAPKGVLQLILACLVSHIVASQLLKQCANAEVIFVTTVTNILTRGLFVLCALEGIVGMKTVSSLSCAFTILVLLPLVIGDIVNLLRMTARYEKTISDPLSWHCSVDAMSTFLVGAVLFACPWILGGRQDEATALATKALGATIIGQSILSFGAIMFRFNDDALGVLSSKLVMHLLCAIVALATFYSDQDFWNDGHPICTAMVFAALTWNAILALTTVDGKCN